MKRWLWISGGLVALLIIVLIFLFSSLDSLIKAAIERYGSEITQTRVRLKEVKLSATSGQGALRGLTMGNPKGFKTERAFRLGEISLRLDVSTVTRNPVVIKEIVLSAPEVTYELGSQGSNIAAIQQNVDTYMARERTKAKDKSKPKGDPRDEQKVIIEHLYIKNGKVHISSTMLQSKTLSVNLPDLHLTDIGKKKGGATPGEVAERVLGALGQGVAKAVATVDTDKVMGTVKRGATGVQGTLEEGAKGASDAFKNLFGK